RTQSQRRRSSTAAAAAVLLGRRSVLSSAASDHSDGVEFDGDDEDSAKAASHRVSRELIARVSYITGSGLLVSTEDDTADAPQDTAVPPVQEPPTKFDPPPTVGPSSKRNSTASLAAATADLNDAVLSTIDEEDAEEAVGCPRSTLESVAYNGFVPCPQSPHAGTSLRASSKATSPPPPTTSAPGQQRRSWLRGKLIGVGAVAKDFYGIDLSSNDMLAVKQVELLPLVRPGTGSDDPLFLRIR
ncbi:hypothetical protein HK405_013013, partial [Cladochytrium tenue]